VAGIAVALTILVGPFDAFAVEMIVGSSVVAVAGLAGIGRFVAPSRRSVAVVALLIGAAWAGATVAVVVLRAVNFLRRAFGGDPTALLAADLN